jgi:hypothetical protein
MTMGKRNLRSASSSQQKQTRCERREEKEGEGGLSQHSAAQGLAKRSPSLPRLPRLPFPVCVSSLPSVSGQSRLLWAEPPRLSLKRLSERRVSRPNTYLTPQQTASCTPPPTLAGSKRAHGTERNGVKVVDFVKGKGG